MVVDLPGVPHVVPEAVVVFVEEGIPLPHLVIDDEVHDEVVDVFVGVEVAGVAVDEECVVHADEGFGLLPKFLVAFPCGAVVGPFTEDAATFPVDTVGAAVVVHFLHEGLVGVEVEIEDVDEVLEEPAEFDVVSEARVVEGAAFVFFNVAIGAPDVLR